MTTAGVLQVESFSNISSIQFGEGKKKFFGGHEPSFLILECHDGRIIFQLINDHDWVVSVSRKAIRALGQYQLKNS